MRWERLQLRQQGQETNGPGKRWGHTCNSVKRGRYLYVFGGYGKDNCQTNNVHVFDTVNQTWSQPMIKGMPPTPRDSHSCTTVGDNLFVFGGTDGTKPLNDLHILETSSHTWISPSIRGEGPDAREGHSAALIGKRLFIFGGSGKSSDDNVEVYYNDLYVLNTETFVWKQATTSGNPPSVRDSHTCSSWKNKIIVIGGEDGHDYYLSDVHILDTETLVWKELSTLGQRLPPRAGHSTVAFGKNLFVFGGFTDAQNLYDDLYMLDIDTGIWTKVMAGGDGPSARFSMAGDSLDPWRGGVLAFLGGCNKNLEALDDMYYLHTGLASLQEERSLDNMSLRKQLKLKCQERNLNSFVHDKALVRIDTNADIRHTMPSYSEPGRENFKLNQMQRHQGKKMFQAKVIESLSNGYSIETIIDGKILHGILFANKPISPPLAIHDNSRKRLSSEIGDESNGDYNATKSSKTLKQGIVDHVQSDTVDGKDGTSNETKTEDAAAPDLETIAPDALQTKEVPANQETPLAPSLNLNEDMIEDTPNTDFNLANENPTVAEGLMTSASNQDVRMGTAQECNELEK